jgi:hypothetical protein
MGLIVPFKPVMNAGVLFHGLLAHLTVTVLSSKFHVIQE